MRLLFKQRFFSWLDSYDVFDESGAAVFRVKGEISFGHKLRIYDAAGQEAGLVKQKVFCWLPQFELYARMGLSDPAAGRHPRRQDRQTDLELDGYICHRRRRPARRAARTDVRARRRRGKMLPQLNKGALPPQKPDAFAAAFACKGEFFPKFCAAGMHLSPFYGILFA